MTKSKTLKLILTRDDEDESVVSVKSQERFPNQFGEVVPPVTVMHENEEFILHREWMNGVYIYHPCNRRSIDDILD